MNTVFKILVILVGATLVGGLLYGVVTVTSSSQSPQFTEGSSSGQLPPDGNFDRPDHDGESSGIQFPMDSIKNLAIISVVGALYFNAAKFLGKRKSIPASV
ncbi:MAG: hypothetical protein JNM55_11420 [Anaerolineales bacterium]|nr:hypothetical protein [Anaerolineales bacterium]